MRRPGDSRLRKLLRAIPWPRSVPAQAAVGVIAMWLFSVLGPLSPLLWGIPIAFLLGRRVKVALLCTLLSPLTFYFIGGIAQYSSGTPTLRAMGLPGHEFWNLHPELRVFSDTGGCLVSGNEWVRDDPHDSAVLLMIRLFGPPAGAYTGPYPTREEAALAVQQATPIDPLDFSKGLVRLPDSKMNLPQRAIWELLHYTPYEQYLLADGLPESVRTKQLPPVTAARWRAGCVIVRVPMQQRDGPSPLLLLIDEKGEKVFAVYTDGSIPRHIPWRLIRR